MSALFVSCMRADIDMPNDYNRRAYDFRYVNIDSSLFYANKAFDFSEKYADGRAEAISHKAFALYVKMCFTEALELVQTIYSLTNNQVELMCADVLLMKITQRTGEWHTFYHAWHNAERRLKRIDEELHLLNNHHLQRVLYARTEMHIIASTYYFYSKQDSSLRTELRYVEPYMLLPRDTAQWCSYMYMLGAGGYLVGDSATVLLKEFDHLTHILTISRRRKDKYFQANSLQALSILLEDSVRRDFIQSQRGGGMDFVIGQYGNAISPQSIDSLSLVLATRSYDLFKDYGDCFQMANVLRTKAELLFRKNRFNEALHKLYQALEIVNEQHSRETKRVPYWEAAIYERLSLTYSAMGQSTKALLYRDKYISCIEGMRQDLEEEIRAEELRSYNTKLYINIFLFVFVLFVVGATYLFFARKLRKHSRRKSREAEETLQFLRDTINAREMELSREKLSNIERRAKVSLAENVVPYLMRMLNTMDMEYIGELSAEILRINDILTDWIQMKQGKVAMNITTFALHPLLDTISKNKSTFLNKGITLDISPIEKVNIKADPALTLFMINTLCDNARKFTPHGGRVVIDVKCEDNYVEISVSDTGCGLSKTNVDKINNSKVFQITSDKSISDSEDKGFGFGLMNCKGIIGQMKKLSNRFSCCEFGVESKLGEGSRFWFRLPRVVSMLIMAFFTCFSALAKDSNYQALAFYENQRLNNVSSQYEKAFIDGKNALQLVHQDSLRLRMQIANELAVSAQSLGMWEDYAKYNEMYLRLYYEITSDPNLPVYARRLHMVKTEITFSWFLTILLIFSSVGCFFLLVRRSNRRRKETFLQVELQQQQIEKLNRVQFELDRLHIQNRILDNCLSTIKHETMYYPARIRQMSLQSNCDFDNLYQLMNYYNDIYTILLSQAQRQTSARMLIDDSILSELRRRIMNSIDNATVSVSVVDHKQLVEIRFKVLDAEIDDNLFTPEAGNLNAFVAREIVRMHDAACGYPGLRLYVENNEIIITLWKNSRLSSLKTFNWN